MENSGKSALGLDTNVAAGLAYLPICLVNVIVSIIILATDKTNKLARFSAFQSLILVGIAVIGYILGMIVIFAGVAANSGILSMLGSLVYIAAFLIFLVCTVIGCIQGFMGKMFKLPVIGDMADKWSN
jgi:uncharacterized membrane protein